MRLSLVVGPGGWIEARWSLKAPPGEKDLRLRAWLRLEQDDDANRWKIAEARLHGWPLAYGAQPFPALKVQNAVNASPWTQEQLLRQIEDDVPLDVRRAFRGRGPQRRPPRVKLERPPGKRVGRDFYRRVAEAYRSAVAHQLNPKQTIQEDTGAAPDTVSGWIRRARDLGDLPEADPGRVSV